MSDELKPVLCIGDLVADIFTSPLKKLPAPGETILTENMAVYPGGNALNIAVALHRMGDTATMVGSIGNDSLGTLILNKLETELGFDVTNIQREKEGRTASTFILRAEGEDRRFISTLGVGEHFTGEYISKDLIPNNGVLLVGGYLKLPNWNDELLIEFLKQAKKQNNKIVLNICVVQNSGVELKRCLKLLKYVDIFLPNQDEARAISGELELENQAKIFNDAGVKTVIITRGDKGLYANDGDQEINMENYNVPIVDPSGCGDCFTAGLISGLRRGWDIISILKFGSAVGAFSAQTLGCTNGVPPFGDVQKFLEENIVKVSVQQIN